MQTATWTGAPADPEAGTVDTMAIGPDGRRRLCERIIAHLEAGGGICLRVYQANREYGPKFRRFFRVDSAGSLYGPGGCWDCVAVTFSINFPFAKKGGRRK